MTLIILGAGGYGRTVRDIACQENRYKDIIFLDDSMENDSEKLEAYRDYISADKEFYPAFGDNELRLRWIERISEAGGAIATIVSSDAYVSPTATIGMGTVVLPKACLSTDVRTGVGVIVNLAAVVDHGCIIGDGVHLAPGAIIKGLNHIPRCTKIESGEVVERGEME